MRYSAAEKAEMIHLIEQSNLPIRQTLKRLDITKSTFYNWLQRFDEDGLDGYTIVNLILALCGISCLKVSAMRLSSCRSPSLNYPPKSRR